MIAGQQQYRRRDQHPDILVAGTVLEKATRTRRSSTTGPAAAADGAADTDVAAAGDGVAVAACGVATPTGTSTLALMSAPKAFLVYGIFQSEGARGGTREHGQRVQRSQQRQQDRGRARKGGSKGIREQGSQKAEP